VAPRELQLPGTVAHRPHGYERTTVDERILAQRAEASPTDQEDKGSVERRSCFYCLEGWVFLGSLGHDGEEVYEAIRCRRCKGTARINP
jgi:hypothetical protein